MTVQLAEFQRAAVERIVERLRDPSGSRRFLLADEVGLGKTLVAAGVIERLLGGRRSPLVVVYVCSNAEIAEQNRRKLDPDARRPVRRVAQLALEATDRNARRQFYSFTPGTSLQEGTGMGWERRLIMFLLHRLFDKDMGRRRWREFFRCGVSEERWHGEARLSALLDGYGRRLTLPFQDRLREEWRRPVKIDGQELVLARAIDEEVERFREVGPTEDARRRRNRIVSALRRGLQQVALDHLDADLVILDEVQRFKEVLEQADDPTSVTSRLFRKGSVAVLILSATPYKMLTLEHEEGEDHYQDLCKTLDFLRRRRPGEGPDPIRQDLDRFKKRLLEGHFLDGPDPELRRIKERLETQLKQVMCRTERNWYVEDAGKGVQEVRPGDGVGTVPQSEELADFVRLRRFLLDRVETGYHITEYWKSGPSPFTFMDGHYAVMQAIRKRGSRVPRGLVAEDGTLAGLVTRNQRMRALFERVLPSAREEGSRRWRFLWVRPTYLYYKDDFFGNEGPAKFLVFSSWRFVPKAVSVLVSEAIGQRVGWRPAVEESSPLRFAEKRSFHIFDVCFPSAALASVVDLAALATEPGLTPKRIVERVERELRSRLEACGVVVGDVGNDPIWQIAARLEGHETGASRLAAELRVASIEAAEEAGTRYFERHRGRLLRWMADQDRPLRMSRARLRRLARIAAWSPAVSLLRALWSVYPDHRGSVPDGLVQVCMNALRNYLNRPVVRAVVDGYATERAERGHYTDRVLRYCRDAHIQAMLDEYVFLLREVSRCEEVEDAVAQIRRVLGLGTGTPKINVAGAIRGATAEIASEPVPQRTHLALAFGEDVADERDEAEAGSRSERKTAIREAFNSPFWPFVLATTSVGQEGLDFHLYCRDIVHWNLPSNPVDLEQREGRINRRDGLTIRRRMARDWPLARAAPFRHEGQHNPWQWVFGALEESESLQRYKHGLYPHWVYESEHEDAERIRRHLFFYDASVDARRYEVLKEGLAFYRLVFGQPRQQDLLDTLERKMARAVEEGPRADFRATLPYYMINLSPFEGSYALERAEFEAGRILAEPDPERRQESLQRLVSDVRTMVEARSDELAGVREDLERLLTLVDEASTAREERGRIRWAIAALMYLRNPYDRLFDAQRGVGLTDDAEVVRTACRAVFGSGNDQSDHGAGLAVS